MKFDRTFLPFSSAETRAQMLIRPKSIGRQVASVTKYFPFKYIRSPSRPYGPICPDCPSDDNHSCPLHQKQETFHCKGQKSKPDPLKSTGLRTLQYCGFKTLQAPCLYIRVFKSLIPDKPRTAHTKHSFSNTIKIYVFRKPKILLYPYKL